MNHTLTRRACLPLALGIAALALTACGSGGRRSGPNGQVTVPTQESPIYQLLVNGRHGGTLTVLDHADFVHLDPGQAYTSLDYEITSATQRTLYSYLPNNTQIAVPDLASGQPQVSANGLTVTVNIKPGVHFSPPVDREVTAADVVYAFDRALNPHVATPYFRVYFGDLVGASHAHGGPFPGVTARGRYTIVFHLDRPTASTLIAALVLPITAPVPPELARPLDAQDPTTYGSQYLAASGPYMLAADAQGRVLGVGYSPGHFAVLVRNPNWNPYTDYRPAYLDRVVIHIGGDSTAIGRAVLRGSQIVQNDPPAGSIVALAYHDFTPQMVISTGAAVRYVALNNRRGPFANLNLRRALWAALDRQALVAASGGSLTGRVATHFIYPGTPGFAAAGGYAGPQVDYNRSLTGNAAVAAKYLRLAGYPSGRYSGRPVTVVGANGEPGTAEAEIVNRTLIDLGFRTRLLLVAPSEMLSRYCGVPAREVDVCPDVSRTRDFASAQGLLAPAFSGASITRNDNANYGQVDIPAITRQMDAATLLTSPDAVAQAWAQVDDELVDQAVAVPFQFVNAPEVESCDVAGVSQQWNDSAWDYAFTSLKQGCPPPAAP